MRMETACVLPEVPGTSVKRRALKCGDKEESSFRRGSRMRDTNTRQASMAAAGEVLPLHSLPR